MKTEKFKETVLYSLLYTYLVCFLKFVKYIELKYCGTESYVFRLYSK